MRHSWVDGEVATVIPLDDRGLNYADGAFETLLCRNGHITCVALHQERLIRALTALRFEAPRLRAEKIFEQVGRCLLQVKHTGPARLTVTRGSGPRGYAPPAEGLPRVILTASAPINDQQVAWRCGIASTQWQDQPQLAGLKLLARTEQVLAAGEAATQGWDDVLMLDHQGNVISSSRGNVFLIDNRTALTPPLDRSGIAGTRRQLLIESVLPRLGYEVRLRPVSVHDFMAAECVMISNTVVGVVTVAAIEQHAYPEHGSAFQAIKEALSELIK